MSNIVTVSLNQAVSKPIFVSYASFALEPTAKNRALVYDLDVLHQELDSLFSTRQYERPYQPEYYNPLEEILGELWTASTSTLALHLVTDKINQFIPRVQVNNKTNFSYNAYRIAMDLVISYKNDFTNTLYNYQRDFNVVT